jgi:cytochrome c peroxidase
VNKFFAFLLVAFAVSSCLEDRQITTSPASEPLSFSNEERAVLGEELNLDNFLPVAEVRLPRHIASGTPDGSDRITIPPGDQSKALLGRVLFYDTQLSATGETSCATCHKQELAFGDDLAFSKGINGAVTKRNSIALGSVPTFASEISGYGETQDDGSTVTQGTVAFFWDERAETIKQQSTMTIEDEIEMGRDLEELAEDLRRQEMYRILSRKAYGTDNLTADRITLALEKFCASITSMDTPFDDLMDARFFQPQEELERNFSAEQIRGLELFGQNCASCHGFNLTQPVEPIASNGLDQDPTDPGVGKFRGEAFDGVFKVPFLRNVALTGPYMHDGRFATLREVVDHYSEGIQPHRNLHHTFFQRFGNTGGFQFSEEDKRALVTFLEMTTDRTVPFDARLSDPFRAK